MNSKWIAAPLVFGLLGGCATLDRSAMSYKPDQKGGDGQRVFIWKSNYSAGIASHGGVCAQGALTTEAKSSQITAQLSAEVLKAFSQIPGASAASGDLAKVSRSAASNVMLTNATNGQTAFANLAFFYLCQISLNSQSLSGDQIVQMWKITHDQVAKVSADSAAVQKLFAPSISEGVSSDPGDVPANASNDGNDGES